MGNSRCPWFRNEIRKVTLFANQPGSRISTLAKWIPPELRLLLLHAPFVSIEIIRSARPRNLNRRRTARRKFDFSGPVYTTLPRAVRRETSPRRTVPSNYNVGLRNLVRSSVTWSLLPPRSSLPLRVTVNRLAVSASRDIITGFRAEITFIASGVRREAR